MFVELCYDTHDSLKAPWQVAKDGHIQHEHTVYFASVACSILYVYCTCKDECKLSSHVFKPKSLPLPQKINKTKSLKPAAL